MRKQKYFYNPETLRYEKATTAKTTKMLKAIAYFSSILLLSGLVTWALFTIIESPKEKMLKRDLKRIESEYKALDNRIDVSLDILSDMADRDDNIYRVIFEAEPISQEVRDAAIGGSNRYAYLDNVNYGEVVKQTKYSLDNLERKLAIQSKSYDKIKSLLEEKEKMLASIPAIQPLSKSSDHYLSSGFGRRYHPIYKTRRMHPGLDFSAAIGVDVYSTGNGIIDKVQKKRSGYGSHIIVDHGFGYKTLYAHLSAIDVKKGQRVERGEVIGKVGNTGTSTAPHLHYEVIKNDSKINPIHFFFNDLTPEEYEEIIDKAEQSNQSFD